MITPEAISIIKHYESLHDGDLKAVGLQPKACPVGIWTIGYGHAIVDPKTDKVLRGLKDKARAYQLYPAMSLPEAEGLLIRDLSDIEPRVRRALKARNVTEQQVGACVSLAFNIGLDAFLNSTALRRLNIGDTKGAAAAFLWWNKGNIDADPELEVLPGLTYRRETESHYLLTGQVVFYNVAA